MPLRRVRAGRSNQSVLTVARGIVAAIQSSASLTSAPGRLISVNLGQEHFVQNAPVEGDLPCLSRSTIFGSKQRISILRNRRTFFGSRAGSFTCPIYLGSSLRSVCSTRQL